jgi:hypothetical protein
MMRTTIELDKQSHERLRRQAQRQGISLARLLGKLVESAERIAGNEPVPEIRSGRFRTIAGIRPGARTASHVVQKVIDEEGIL